MYQPDSEIIMITQDNAIPVYDIGSDNSIGKLNTDIYKLPLAKITLTGPYQSGDPSQGAIQFYYH